jgi:Uma2 family endonuclease
MKLNKVEHFLSEKEYLAGEQDGQVRHELIDGQAYAMTGASDYHNRLSGNLFAELRNALKHINSPCIAYVNDMKLKVFSDFYYPDVMVVCDRQDTQNDYYKTRPLVIVEVLSPSTRRFDKTHKRLAYQALESLQEYVLVEQDKAEVEVFTRQSGWQADYFYPGDVLTFQSIDISIAVEDVYYQVDNDDILTFLQARSGE